MKLIRSDRMPVVMLKSVRSRASCSSHYAFTDSIQSIFPSFQLKIATARYTWS